MPTTVRTSKQPLIAVQQPALTFASVQHGQTFRLPGDQAIYRRPWRNEVLRDPAATCYTIHFDITGIRRVLDYIAPEDTIEIQRQP